MFEDETRGCSQPPLIGKINRMFELIDSMEEGARKRKFFELMEVVTICSQSAVVMMS